MTKPITTHCTDD